MKKLLAVLLLLAAAPPATDGGAFGVKMGQPISSLLGAKRFGKGNSFTLASVPKPNSEFDQYMVVATPQTGVCRVSGIGKTHESDSYGTATKAAFQRLHAALEARYGPARDFDFLKAGSIWDEPRDWFMGVLKNERTLASYWTREDGASLPASIESIGMTVETIDAGPYISLRYEFTNFDVCSKSTENSDNEGL